MLCTDRDDSLKSLFQLVFLVDLLIMLSVVDFLLKLDQVLLLLFHCFITEIQRTELIHDGTWLPCILHDESVNLVFHIWVVFPITLRLFEKELQTRVKVSPTPNKVVTSNSLPSEVQLELNN